jgi:hypothetical protein
MAEFLKTSGLTGRLFNEFGTGGYLDWALYPKWQTFIDGRELDHRVFDHYLKIAFGSMELAGGKRLYEFLLDQYQIDVVAMKVALANGHLQPLLPLLLDDPQWQPVFLDGQAFVLVRNTPKNAAAMQKYAMDKTGFLEQLTAAVGSQVNSGSNIAALAILQADILAYTNRQKTGK